MTPGPIPVQSLAQREAALAKAQATRTYRAQLKRDMKAGRVDWRDVLESTDPRLATMKVVDVLLAAPAMGRVKTNKRLVQAGVSPSKTISGLTDRQRCALTGRTVEAEAA